MRKFLTLTLAMTLFCACSNQRDQYFKKELDPRAIKTARKLSIDIPAIDPESEFVMVSCKSFKIRPVEVIDQMYSHFGKNVHNFEKRTTKEILETINITAERFATRLLQINGALNAGIKVSAAELDTALQARYREAKGKDNYMKYLQEYQLKMEDVILGTRGNLLIKKFEEYLYTDLPPVTESDIIRTYQEPKTATVRSIFLSKGNKSDEEIAEVRRRAQEILERATRGENFEELAKTYNEDPATKRSAGFYPNFHRGEMHRQIEQAAFSLPLDSISDIIETEDGFHILKILDRVEETRPLGEVRDEIKRTIIRLRKQAIMDGFLEKAKREENYRFRKLP